MIEEDEFGARKPLETTTYQRRFLSRLAMPELQRLWLAAFHLDIPSLRLHTAQQMASILYD